MRSPASATSCARSSTSASCAFRPPRLRSSAPTRSARTCRRSVRASAGTCRSCGPRSRHWTRRRWHPRCARAHDRPSRSGGPTTSSAARTCWSRSLRSRATASSATAPTPWRWTWRSMRKLIRAGHAREIVHAVQQVRRNEGLDITDRIALALGGAEHLLDAAREHESYIATETLRDERRLTARPGPGRRASRSTAASWRSDWPRQRRTEPPPRQPTHSNSCALELLLGVGADGPS